jgi:hypothetical protein
MIVVRFKKTAELDAQAQILGDVAGYSQAEAKGRLVDLWAQCLRDQTEVLAEKYIRVHLGPRGVEALLEAELGHRQGDLVLVRGARKEIEERVRRSESARRAALVRHGREGAEVSQDTPAVEPEPCATDAPRIRHASATDPVADASPSPSSSDQRSDLTLFPLKPSSETPGDLKQQGSGRKRAKQPEVTFPANFAPGQWHRDYAAANGLDLDREFDRFRDRHEAKGTTFADWSAALRTWLKNAVEWREEKQAKPHWQRERDEIRDIPTLSTKDT